MSRTAFYADKICKLIRVDQAVPGRTKPSASGLGSFEGNPPDRMAQVPQRTGVFMRLPVLSRAPRILYLFNNLIPMFD